MTTTAATTAPDAPARAAHPTERPRRPRPSAFVWVTGIAALAMTLWSAHSIGFTLGPIFEGNPRSAEIIGAYFSPNWEFLARPAVWSAWLETLVMAVVASAMGCLLGLILALLASRTSNPSSWGTRILKWILSVVRSLPEIGYAYLLVAMVGVGALAGVLALIMFNIGIVAKLTSESIDGVDPRPIEAATAAGGTAVQRATTAILPQVWPAYLSYSLYVFELNLRASVILGLVGAGGIGQILEVQRASFNHENVSALVVGLIVIVVVLDVISRIIRKRLIA